MHPKLLFEQCTCLSTDQYYTNSQIHHHINTQDLAQNQEFQRVLTRKNLLICLHQNFFINNVHVYPKISTIKILRSIIRSIHKIGLRTQNSREFYLEDKSAFMPSPKLLLEQCAGYPKISVIESLRSIIRSIHKIGLRTQNSREFYLRQISIYASNDTA